MKNVLITGATGGIGASLIEKFYGDKYNLLLDKISNAKVNKELPAKIAVNSLNFI